MRRAFFFTLVFLNAALAVYGQTSACGVTVNAGTDKSICFPGGITQLNGSVTGDYMSFNWTPPVNPNSLQPTVLVNATTTYTLTVQTYNASANLITNADFSQGNVGFNSDYINDPMQIYLQGYYAIVTSPDLIYANFPPCDDHSPGQGNMMIVDGSANASDDIWCQTVTVTPNTTYAFGAWVGTIVPFALAEIQFMINGQPLGAPITAPSAVCTWTQFSQTWNSGAATSATICIRDLNTTNLGNDFGLDDLFFAPLCTVSDPVTISVIHPVATANLIQFLPCSTGQLTLNAAGSSTGPNYSYQWSTPDGNIVSGANTLNPVVNESGTYTLIVTYNGGGATCTATTNVVVTGDPSNPFAFATPQGQLNCNNPSITLLGAGSSQGANVTYHWTTADGNITSNPNLINIQVDAAGTYVLTVTNTTNGCTATASATIGFNGVLPVAQAMDSMALTCEVTQIQLNGAGSSSGPSFTYLWTTADGSIVNGQTTLTPMVNAAGSYTLTVTNTLTGCENSATVSVLDLQDIPVAVIAPAPDLTCLSSQSVLDATASVAGPDVQVSWSTADGHFASPPDSLTALADEAGTYTLILRNTQSECADTAVVVVQDISVFPQLALAPPGMLSCSSPEVVLSAQDTSSAQAVYAWHTQGGAFSGPPGALSVTITAAGTYWLEAVDTLSGCMASDTLQVFGEALLPTAQIAIPAVLTCTTTQVQLDAGGSSTGPNFVYQWTTPDGNIVSGSQGLQPLVDGPGTYQLLVTDSGNSCSSTAMVTVGIDTLSPLAEAGPGGVLTCTSPNVWLDGSGSQFDTTSIIITWSTPDGQLQGALDSLLVEALSPGQYVLLLSNTQNGCSSADTATVTADQDFPVADAGPPATLNCTATAVQLNGSGSSSGPGIEYHWQTALGNIISGADTPSPQVDLPGWYVLTVLNTASGCAQADSVLVAADQVYPVSDAGPAAGITCAVEAVGLDGSASSQGPAYSYSWTTNGGNIAGNPGMPLTTADQAGIYYLSVTNTINGCAAMDSVAVALDTISPQAEAQAADVLTCTSPVTLLEGNGSSTGPAISYAWSTADGNLVGAVNALQAQADKPGTYMLTVTDTGNGCTAIAQTSVQQDLAFPQAEAGAPGTLTCLVTELTLAGSAGPSGNLSIQWTTLTGNIAGGANTLSPQIAAPGWYYLTVEDPGNNCQAIDSVFIDQNISQPQLNIAPPGPLTCQTQQQTLDAGGSSQGPEFFYAWSTAAGNITGNPNQITAQADKAGMYYLLITNTTNGCTSLDSVALAMDTLSPVSQAQSIGAITCTETASVLSGLGSSAGLGFSYAWTTQNGNITGPLDAQVSSADAPGQYLFTVTNTTNGCKATAEAEVLEDTEFPLVDAGGPVVLTCLAPTAALNATLAATNDMSIQWATFTGNIASGATTLTPQIDAPGWYYITVQNLNNGCLSTDSVYAHENIVLPQIGIAPAAAITCNTPIQTLNASGSSSGPGFTFNWSTSDGNISAGAQTLSPQVDQGGTYVLTIQDNMNGCTASAQVLVAADTFPPLIDAGADGLFPCNAPSVSINGDILNPFGLYTILWTTQDGQLLGNTSSLFIQAGTPGTYVMQVTDQGNGCSSSDAVSFTEQGIEAVDYSLSLPPCPGDSGRITIDFVDGGAPPFQYSIDGGSIFQTVAEFNGLLPGVYEMVVKDAMGCVYSQDVEISNPTAIQILLPAEIMVELGGSVEIHPVVNLSASQIAQIEWVPVSGLSCLDCLYPVATVAQTTAYSVTITDINGCKATANTVIRVDPSVRLYAPNIFSPNADGVNDVFMLFSGEGKIKRVERLIVWSRWGESVFETVNALPNVSNMGWDGTFRGQPAPAGVYTWLAEVEWADGRHAAMQGGVSLVR